MTDFTKVLRETMVANPELPVVAYNASIDPIPGGAVAAVDSIEVNWYYEDDYGNMVLRDDDNRVSYDGLDWYVDDHRVTFTKAIIIYLS